MSLSTETGGLTTPPPTTRPTAIATPSIAAPADAPTRSATIEMSELERAWKDLATSHGTTDYRYIAMLTVAIFAGVTAGWVARRQSVVIGCSTLQMTLGIYNAMSIAPTCSRAMAKFLTVTLRAITFIIRYPQLLLDYHRHHHVLLRARDIRQRIAPRA